jgi:hypothetical protein
MGFYVINRDKILAETIEKEYFFFEVLKGCWIICCLELKISIEVTRGKLELNLKRECVNIQKCRKYLKISGNTLKFFKSFN